MPLLASPHPEERPQGRVSKDAQRMCSLIPRFTKLAQCGRGDFSQCALLNMSQGVLPAGKGGMRSRSAIGSPAS